MPPDKFFSMIEQAVNLWCREQPMACDLDDFNELMGDLDDRVSAKANRVAQGAVKRFMGAQLEPIFHPDSYGYRPGRSAHNALKQCEKRCRTRSWAGIQPERNRIARRHNCIAGLSLLDVD